MSRRPERLTTSTSPTPACIQWERLLTVSSFHTLMPDERAKLLEHLAGCAYCRDVRVEYEAIEALMQLVAREAPTEVARLLSPEAAARVHAYLIGEPPDGLPSALLALWEDEGRRRAVVEQPSTAAEPAAEAASQPLALAPRPTPPPARGATGAPRTSVALIEQPVRRLASLLHVPDHPVEVAHASYSPKIAERLVTGYRYLKLNRFFDAYATLYPCQERAMSRLQRLRLWYALAHASAGTDAYGQALAFVDEALGQANLLEDVGACAELAYLRGSINGALQNFSDAVGDLLQATRALRSLTSTSESADPDLELNMLLPLASFSFLTSRFEEVDEYLAQAKRLIPLSEHGLLHSATVDWLSALLLRWSGRSEQALRAAMAATDAYLRPELHAMPLLQARILAVTADCALDLAERLPGRPAADRDAILTFARRYAIRAVNVALESAGGQTAEAQAVNGFTWLTKARFERLAHRQTDRVALCQRVIRTAQTLGDNPLLTQALTTLGDEWADRGEVNLSLAFYQQALNAQASGDSSALSRAARRKLLLNTELSIESGTPG